MLDPAVLRQLPPLADFRDEDLALLAGVLRERQFVAGDLLVNEGEIGSDLFLLLAGEVAVLRTGARNEQKQVAVIGAGEIFGEMSFLDRKPRTASVRAAKTSRVLVLTREKFELLYQENLGVYARFLRLIADTITARLRKLGLQVNQRSLWA